MARKLMTRLVNLLENVENLIFRQGGGQPPAMFAIAGTHSPLDSTIREKSSSSFDWKSLIGGDGILWAVPKHRRSVEKRLKRKFGNPDYVWKLLKVKTNLRNCIQCGHDHEVGVLCPHCYAKVRDETKQMQDKIQEKLGLEPVEQEVIVLYEGERSHQLPEVLNGKRIVEMPKPRPMWFSKNLMQKTTQQPAETKEVKPNDLA